MAKEDLKSDFGGWLDAQITELDKIIVGIEHGGDWTTSIEIYKARRFALSIARCEFWEVLAR